MSFIKYISLICSRLKVNFLKSIILVFLSFYSSVSSSELNEPIKPIPLSVPYNKELALLGRKLFFDVSLSNDNSISCSSCHILDDGGDDGKRFPIGVKGTLGTINSPTAYNTRFNFKQTWSGQFDDLSDQVDMPIQEDHEMGSTWPGLIARLYEDKDYPDMFKRIFSEPIKREHIKDAIAEFQLSLITPNSPFDKYLNGDNSAINQLEKDGYTYFKKYGCISCHQGVNVGGNMFQLFGVINNYFQERGEDIQKSDLGRFNVTGREQDKHVFKVPSLRMVEHTAPYFHDGSMNTLKEAVDAMFRYQLGRSAPEEHKDAIVAFLKTLDGIPQGESL